MILEWISQAERAQHTDRSLAHVSFRLRIGLRMAPSCLAACTGALSHRELALWLLSALERLENEEFPNSFMRASDGGKRKEPLALSDTRTGVAAIVSHSSSEK